MWSVPDFYNRMNITSDENFENINDALPKFHPYHNTLTYISLIFFGASSLWGDSVSNHKGLSTLKY